MPRLRRVVPSLLAVVLLGAPSARADGRDPVAGEALFREGRKAIEGGDYAAACPKFEESYRLDPAAGALLSLADCEEHIGHLASAWVRYRLVLDLLAKDDDRRSFVEERWHVLDRRLPRLTLKLDPSSPTTVRVVRDGVELGPASRGVALAIDPGPHVVKVSAEGRAERSFDVTLREGESRELVVAPGDPVGPSSAADASATSGSGRRAAEWVLFGVGAVGIGAGSFFGAHALARESDSRSLCSGDACRDPAGVADHSSAQSSALAADILLGVGIAAVATAVVLIVTSKAPSVQTLGRAAFVGVSW